MNRLTKKYNEIEVKNNMQVEVDNNGEETVVEQNEKQPLQKIVQVQPKKVKRSLFGRLITGIVGPDGLPGIGAQVNEEIIKPAVKNIVFDAITSGLSRALNLDYRQPRGGYSSYNKSPQVHRPSTNYSNRFLNSRQEPEERRVSVRSGRYNVEDYVIDNRNDAAHVLVTLKENADRYDVTSVADYYDLIGVPQEYTDNDWGWTIDSIVHATILPVRGGYIIKFPPVEVIK
jgi:hypothetical protein